MKEHVRDVAGGLFPRELEAIGDLTSQRQGC